MPGKRTSRARWQCAREACGHFFAAHLHQTTEGWVDWDNTKCTTPGCKCPAMKSDSKEA